MLWANKRLTKPFWLAFEISNLLFVFQTRVTANSDETLFRGFMVENGAWLYTRKIGGNVTEKGIVGRSQRFQLMAVDVIMLAGTLLQSGLRLIGRKTIHDSYRSFARDYRLQCLSNASGYYFLSIEKQMFLGRWNATLAPIHNIEKVCDVNQVSRRLVTGRNQPSKRLWWAESPAVLA